MAMTIYTKPDKYGAAYSALPLRIKSNNVDKDMDFKYIINLTYDKINVIGGEPIGDDGIIATIIETSSNHNFERGDVVIINNTIYSGIYNILSIVDSTHIVIDLILGKPYPSDGYVSRTIKYTMSPDFEGEAKLDISGTLKDFVTQNLEDVNDTFNGKDTSFNYDIVLGEESRYVFEFDDNYFTSRGVGFNNNSMTAGDIPNLPFQIGDEINIQQDTYRWDFDDNYFVDGDVGFISTTEHNFRVGQQVNVSGAIINDYYNGPSTVVNVVDDYKFSISKPWGSNTQPEPGFVIGVPRPEYNAVAKIMDIYFVSGYGVVIETDIPYGGGTSEIGGKITFADNRISERLFESTISDNYVYNARTATNEYSIDEFNKYVIKGDEVVDNISTILGNKEKYRIEKDTKSWLLVHTDDNMLVNEIRYKFMDINGDLLGYINMAISGGNKMNFYAPVGVNQINNSLNNSGSISMSTYIDDIHTYEVYCVNSINETISNIIKFELNDDCSRYEMFHLMWKDRRGSWLSYPFKYINRKSTEFERKTYYKKTGEFDTTNNSFGYNSFDRGENSYYTRGRDTISLNSGWVEEYENELIKDLMISASVYIQQPNGDLIGCIINDNKMEFKQSINDQLWNYNLEVRVSMNDYRM